MRRKRYAVLVNVEAVLLYCTSYCISLFTCAFQEEERYEKAEKEYENAAEIAREDEAELRYV